MKRHIEPYYVITWNFNDTEIVKYDIMPYLIDKYKERKKSRRKNNIVPKTFDEIKEFILNESIYQFYSRCQYEVVVSPWPPSPERNDDGSIKIYDYNVYGPGWGKISTIVFRDQKIDVHYQIKMNIDVITNHFMKQI